MSEEEIKRFLGELCIKGFATIMESQIDDEKNKGVGWDIAKATLKSFGVKIELPVKEK